VDWLATIQMELHASSRSFVPSETLLHFRWPRPNKLNFQAYFLELPRPRNAVWSDKMALLLASVNLWETLEVS
jgi:hypothetical protein